MAVYNTGGDTLISVLDPGNSNEVLCFEWIKHFKWFTITRQHGKWRLLLLYSTVTAQGRSLISAMITPFHPHKTHLLQPLDLVCFQPYKLFRAEAVDAATRTGCSDFKKLEFFAGLSTIHEQTFKRTTILFAFRQTGPIPFNPDIVLSKLPAATPSPSSTSPPADCTPSSKLFPAPFAHSSGKRRSLEL